MPKFKILAKNSKTDNKYPIIYYRFSWFKPKLIKKIPIIYYRFLYISHVKPKSYLNELS